MTDKAKTDKPSSEKPENDTVIVNFRLPRVTRGQFKAVCEKNDVLMAQALRAYILEVLESQNPEQGSLF